jgi:RimJ/RimL family protein N-acetyltransferase
MKNLMPTPKIIEATQEDWEVFKNIRLTALKTNPDVFCPTTNEFERSDLEWKDMLKSDSVFKIFILKLEENVIGLTGIVRDSVDKSGKTGLFVMSFVLPEYRGLGFSKYFYEARINWAKISKKYKRLKVGHRQGNEPSRRANQKYGFKLYEIVDHSFGCGTVDKLYNYELII